MRNFSFVATLTLAALSPISLIAFSTGPPALRTGSAVDGGLSCTACHRDGGAANSDPKGSFRLEVGRYTPGVPLKIKVIIAHPDQSRWGFQLTARLASDETKAAGTFTSTDLVQVRCADGTTGNPCGGATEFLEHRQVGTFAGQTGGNTWEVEWTPPATNVGDVVFYAAGNAANNNASPTGDHIYTTSARSAAPCVLTGKPTITSVRNGASMIDGPVAINTLVTIAGTGFAAAGAARSADSSDFVDGKYPTSFACIAVEVGSARAVLTYVNATQIGAQLPSISDVGPVQVRAIANPGEPAEIRGDAITVQMADTSPAFYRLLPNPTIVGTIAPSGVYTGDPNLVPGLVPAKIGDVVTLFATGLGVTDPFYQAGEIVNAPASMRDLVTVEWMGRVMDKADAQYIGLAPGNISGLYAITLRVPTYAKTGGVHNEVRIRTGNRLSPESTTVFVK